MCYFDSKNSLSVGKWKKIEYPLELQQSSWISEARRCHCQRCSRFRLYYYAEKIQGIYSVILKLFINTKGVASLKNLRNIFQTLLMLYCIIKLSKSFYFASIMQSTSESSIITRIQKNVCLDEAWVSHYSYIILKFQGSCASTFL